MEDLFRFVVYGIFIVLWLVASRKGQHKEPGPWEELPPAPKPRRPAPTRSPAPDPTNAYPILIRKRGQPAAPPKPAVDIVRALEHVAAARVATPPPSPAPLLVCAPPVVTSGWSVDLSTEKGIAEGFILSAILGPPKASAYLRRVTQYWGVPS